MIKGYTTLILDMYGVIIEESKGNFIPYTYAHFPESEYNRLIRQFKQEKLFTKAGNGEMSSNEFLSELGYKDPDATMRDYIENHLTLDKGFIPFAERVKDKYELVLLSNDVSEWSEHITKHFGLDKYFSHKIISANLKCRKPELEIYDKTLELIGRSAAECIFVDNSVKNLHSAEEVGMSAILFNRDNEHFEGTVVYNFDELLGYIG
ncbi:MAG: HAD-IA family hydrolase [Clostridia bacterium]|nr:HAD-IA family hydrolase [Clostridia bacterium]